MSRTYPKCKSPGFWASYRRRWLDVDAGTAYSDLRVLDANDDLRAAERNDFFKISYAFRG